MIFLKALTGLLFIIATIGFFFYKDESEKLGRKVSNLKNRIRNMKDNLHVQSVSFSDIKILDTQRHHIENIRLPYVINVYKASSYALRILAAIFVFLQILSLF